MKVFSGFNGSGTVFQILKDLRIPFEGVSSEVDAVANSVSAYHHPEVKQLGDIRLVDVEEGEFDLMCFGSPCTDLSIAGLRAGLLADTLEGYMELKEAGYDFGNKQSYLFWEAVRLVRKCKPNKVFFENVATMSESDKNIISSMLGMEPQYVDSAWHTPQSRHRLYWTNFGEIEVEVNHSKLSDILQDPSEVDPKYTYTLDGIDYMLRAAGKSGHDHFRRHEQFSDDDKSVAVVANFFKGMPYNCILVKGQKTYYRMDEGKWSNGFELQGLIPESPKEKGNYLPRERVFTARGKSRVVACNYSQFPYYEVGDTVRRLTPVECHRLQGLTDHYNAFGIKNGKVVEISDTQQYKLIGNGWQRDTVELFFKLLV